MRDDVVQSDQQGESHTKQMDDIHIGVGVG